MSLTSNIDHSRLLDLLPDLVCAVGPDGTFSYVNAACEVLLGYQREEMQGRLMLDFVHPDDRQRTLDSARHVVAGQPLACFENRYRRKDGTFACLMWSARWSDRDKVRVAVARDVTAQRSEDGFSELVGRNAEAPVTKKG
jgi:PAS domain S-box-containing protein